MLTWVQFVYRPPGLIYFHALSPQSFTVTNINVDHVVFFFFPLSSHYFSRNKGSLYIDWSANTFFVKVWRHGSQHQLRQVDRWHLLALRSLGHRPSRPRHCVEFLSHLSPEPTGRQTESPKGNSIVYCKCTMEKINC